MKKVSSIKPTEGTLTIVFNDKTELHLDFSMEELSISVGKINQFESDINIIIEKNNEVYIDYPKVKYNK